MMNATKKSLNRMARAATLGVLAAGTTAAVAQPQTDLVNPTGWYWQYNVDLAGVTDLVNNHNQRVVDIEIESVSPFKVSAATVTNAGAYAKGWWWYVGQTEADVNNTLSANNSRLIDIEPYTTASGLRFATVQIHDTGTDHSDGNAWYYGLTANGVVDWVNLHPTWRLLRIQPYDSSGNLRYAVVAVKNSGNLAKSSWAYYANASIGTINSYVGSHNVRLIDLEQQTNGNYSAVMVPTDGNAWWYYHNVTSSYLTDQINQNAARVTDLEYDPGSNRFSAILRRNDNDLAIDTNLDMRDITDGTSGFLLTQMDGPELAGVQEFKVFEPASLLKTWYHASAMRSISLGNDSLGANIVVNEGLSGSCPNGTVPTAQTVQQSLTDMMVSSSNADTEAIRQRYGQGWMDLNATVMGMVNTHTNHVVGCFCNAPRNQITLDDLASLYQSVNDGYLGAQTNNFYNIMINGLSTDQGGGMTFQQVLDAELAVSTLDAADRTDFRAQVFHASKGGSYTCFGGLNDGEYRSHGGMFRVPFRVGCRDITREYAYGAWVNDASSGANATLAVGTACTDLFRDRVAAAIESWEDSACGCPGDVNGDGFLDQGDLQAFLKLFLGGDLGADFNTDGFLDNGDIAAFLEHFLAGC